MASSDTTSGERRTQWVIYIRGSGGESTRREGRFIIFFEDALLLLSPVWVFDIFFILIPIHFTLSKNRELIKVFPF